jgi:phage FluMu gp28-like protein
MTTIRLRLPPVASYQQEAIFCPDKLSVIDGSTKSGKTQPCAWWLSMMAAQHGGIGREFWWIAPIADQARIAYRRVRAMWLSVDPKQEMWTDNRTEKSISLANGSILRFKGSDDPDSLYGEDVYAVVLDEASRCKEEAWHAANSLVTATGGWIRVIGNVKGRKNWAFQLGQKVKAGAIKGRYRKVTVHDAIREGIITPEAMAQARERLPEQVFRELYEAEPSEDGANPFGLSHIAECVRLHQQTAAKPAHFGVDLAKSVDWTVCIGLAGGAVVAFDRWQHEPWDRTQDRILDLIGHVPALVDSTGVGDPVVEGLQRRGAGNVEGFKFSSTSKQQLMEGLAVAIQRHEVTFPDGVLREELESFEYEVTRTGVRYSAPEGQHDDCVCALALAVERARRGVLTVEWMSNAPAAVDPNATMVVDYAAARRDLDWGF